MTMNNPFEILAGFLAKHGSEVEGRSIEEPPTEVKAQLRDFVHGRLPEAEQALLFQRLKDTPEWIGALAEAARAEQIVSGK